MLSPSASQQRLVAVRRSLERIDAAAVVFGLSANMRYLTGFSDEPGERMLALVVPRDGEPTMIVPELYADQVRAFAPACNMRVWGDGEDPTSIVGDVAQELEAQTGRLLLDNTLWTAIALPWERAFPGRDVGLASEIMTELRMRKIPEEIDCMQRAGEITDRALEDALSRPIGGRTELELARHLEWAMLDRGADGVAFETLVASGSNSAFPHYRAGQRRIESGDVVIMDFGCRVGGYCSDITRTVTCGEVSAEVNDAYDVVREAHATARDHAERGVPAQEVDRAARRVLAEAGYGDAFCHRTGHGVGLDVHEPPYIVEGNSTNLEPGMAFSIEPGVYFSGSFGVRLEDVVIVTEGGAKPLTEAPRELRAVE
jgi:Xaa-Pro aminopeptidase